MNAGREEDDQPEQFEEDKMEQPIRSKMEKLLLEDNEKEMRARTLITQVGEYELANERYKVVY